VRAKEEDSMIRENEVELWEALDMLDVDEEVLGRLAEAGKVKSRRADSTIYFLREEIEQIIDREIEVIRSGECEPSQLVSRMDRTCSEVAARHQARARRVA
jgi:hypothetical protein